MAAVKKVCVHADEGNVALCCVFIGAQRMKISQNHGFIDETKPQRITRDMF